MEGPFDAGAVVMAELPDPLRHRLDIGVGDLAIGKRMTDPIDETRLDRSPEVEHNLEKVIALRIGGQRGLQVGGKHLEQLVEVVGDPVLGARKRRRPLRGNDRDGIRVQVGSIQGICRDGPPGTRSNGMRPVYRRACRLA